MKTLTDYLLEHAEKARAEAVQNEGKRNEWVRSVERLQHQLEDWLRKADTQNVLDIQRIAYPIEEEGIGPYTVHRLKVRLGKKAILLIAPVARNVVGRVSEDGPRFQGRVDMVYGGRKFILYRISVNEPDKWVLVDDRDFSMRPLDQKSFEEAVLSLLE